MLTFVLFATPWLVSVRETHVWTVPEVCGPCSFLYDISLPTGPERSRPVWRNVAAAKHDHPRSPVATVPHEDHPFHLDGDSYHILGHRSWVQTHTHTHTLCIPSTLYFYHVILFPFHLPDTQSRLCLISQAPTLLQLHHPRRVKDITSHWGVINPQTSIMPGNCMYR